MSDITLTPHRFSDIDADIDALIAPPTPEHAQTPLDDLLQDLPAGMLPVREAARATFLRLGLPTIKSEDWRYTNLSALASYRFAVSGDNDPVLHSDDIPALTTGKSHRVVMVNGLVKEEFSHLADLPPDVVVERIGDAPVGLAAITLGSIAAWDENAFVALNTALFQDGILIHVPRGVVVQDPIEIVAITLTQDGSLPIAVFPRVIIVAEANSAVTVIEHHVSRGSTVILNGNVTEIQAEEGATVRHLILQNEHKNAFHVGYAATRLQRGAHCESFVLHTGGRLSRRRVRQFLVEPEAISTVRGVYVLDGQQHSDIATHIDHAAPNCQSRQLVKGVLDGESHGVFQGKVLVRPNSQKTDGYQLNRALLLSERAIVDTKPELEIYADDVKCSHGASVGTLDKDALFYLRTRGLDEATARVLLTHAFIDDVLDEVFSDNANPAQEAIRALVSAALHEKSAHETV